MVTIVNNTLIYWKVTKRVGLKSSDHKNKNYNCAVMDVNQTFCSDHFAIYINIKLLYRIPEMNMLCISDMSIKI